MKTATTRSLMSSIRVAPDACGAKVSEEAIDKYACKVLQRLSEDETVIDSNLGPYVTSLLRCADIHSTDELSEMAEYDSLLELLEDQCNMNKDVATDALRTIAQAVVTQILPLSEMATVNGKINRKIAKLGLYTGDESSLDSFQSMREQLPANGNGTSAISIEPYTPTGGPSPLKPDNLIPSELLGVLDEASPTTTVTAPTASLHKLGQYSQQNGTQVFQYHTPPTNKNARPPTIPHPQQTLHRQIHAQHQYQQHYQHNILSSPLAPQSASLPDKNDEDFPPLGKVSDEDEFPSLGTSSGKPKRSRPGSTKKSNVTSSGGTNSTPQKSNKKNNLNKQQQGSDLSDKDLAAALFRPARPRQNSIESEQDGSSSNQRSRGSSVGSYHAAQPSTALAENDDASSAAYNMMNDYYFQQQLASCIEILLAMNQELSEEAATEAAMISQLDFNLAQYIVDTAMTAPPICKYMIQDGSKCFRSDCVFSHDIDGHTCLFWIRGRCGKGSSCKFLHGFNTNNLSTASMYAATDGSTLSNLEPVYNGTAAPRNPYGSYPQDPSSGFSHHVAPEIAASKSYSPSESTFSFANVASKGYDKNKFQDASSPLPSLASFSAVSTIRIPQDLWNPHENRDAAWFDIADPFERYQKVATTVHRPDVIDLHFQSTKTFSDVLSLILPEKLGEMDQVWIVTGTGHHVGSKTHQKGGGALEQSVTQWLMEEGYSFQQGRDRNGLGGALLVKR